MKSFEKINKNSCSERVKFVFKMLKLVSKHQNCLVLHFLCKDWDGFRTKKMPEKGSNYTNQPTATEICLET